MIGTVINHYSLTLVNFAPCHFDHFALCLCQLYPPMIVNFAPNEMITFPFFQKYQKPQF